MEDILQLYAKLIFDYVVGQNKIRWSALSVRPKVTRLPSTARACDSNKLSKYMNLDSFIGTLHIHPWSILAGSGIGLNC
ncbi:hypothetical protein [Herbaspirillum seropedicae]|uniref:hypothetical protein n=1 Tax=Herbaspirillum seropedicae TaxID=964 RepID=UPI003D96E4A1